MRTMHVGAVVAAGLVAAAIALSPPANANELETFRDWTAFAKGEGESRICWIQSKPTKWRASRKNVRRGDIRLAVAIRPSVGVVNEVSYRPGYTFRVDSVVSVTVGARKAELFTKDNHAWPNGPKEDEALVKMFRRGAKAVVKGVSSRGTETTDTFSLIGFTAALERASGACTESAGNAG